MKDSNYNRQLTRKNVYNGFKVEVDKVDYLKLAMDMSAISLLNRAPESLAVVCGALADEISALKARMSEYEQNTDLSVESNFEVTVEAPVETLEKVPEKLPRKPKRKLRK